MLSLDSILAFFKCISFSQLKSIYFTIEYGSFKKCFRLGLWHLATFGNEILCEKWMIMMVQKLFHIIKLFDSLVVNWIKHDGLHGLIR